MSLLLCNARQGGKVPETGRGHAEKIYFRHAPGIYFTISYAYILQYQFMDVSALGGYVALMQPAVLLHQLAVELSFHGFYFENLLAR